MIVQEGQSGFYTASKLLTKIREMGFELPDDLWRLAVARGLRYYDGESQFEKLSRDPKYQVSINQLSNVELGVALLSPDLPADSASKRQWCHRVGSALISAENVETEELASLAEAERCQALVHWIATCGNDVEPDNTFWTDLLSLLPESDKPEQAPHPTRFFEMTGMTREKVGIQRRWLRLSVS